MALPMPARERPDPDRGSVNESAAADKSGGVVGAMTRNQIIAFDGNQTT